MPDAAEHLRPSDEFPASDCERQLLYFGHCSSYRSDICLYLVLITILSEISFRPSKMIPPQAMALTLSFIRLAPQGIPASPARFAKSQATENFCSDPVLGDPDFQVPMCCEFSDDGQHLNFCKAPPKPAEPSDPHVSGCYDAESGELRGEEVCCVDSGDRVCGITSPIAAA